MYTFIYLSELGFLTGFEMYEMKHEYNKMNEVLTQTHISFLRCGKGKQKQPQNQQFANEQRAINVLRKILFIVVWIVYIGIGRVVLSKVESFWGESMQTVSNRPIYTCTFAVYMHRLLWGRLLVKRAIWNRKISMNHLSSTHSHVKEHSHFEMQFISMIHSP